MRETLYSLIAIIPLLLAASCTQKEQEIPVPQLSFIDQVVADYEKVTITCSVAGNMSAERLIITYSPDESLATAQSLPCEKKGDAFVLVITGLDIQTTYYYRYTVENQVSSFTDQRVKSFKTKDYAVPEVVTGAASDILATTATLSGIVEFTCYKTVTERGFFYGKDQKNLERKAINGEEFSLSIDNLDYGAKYYYQAYATTEIGIGIGELKEFVTLSGDPEMSTTPVTSIATYKATLNGEITSDGGSPIKERGFCYATTETPTLEGNKVQVEGTIGVFSSEISGLTPATKYYARIYAINEKGTHYGNVIEFTTEAVPVASVSLDKPNLTLIKGNTATLKATVLPEDATDKTVTWSSSAPAVASVDQSGKVTAVLGGSATITAKAGDKTAICTVTVIAYVESVTLNKSSITIAKGSSETLIATVNPDDATDKTVTWISSNTSVASVDQNGKVTALKGGEATITAAASGKTATCKVTVTAAVTSVTLNKTTLTLDKGKSETLVATVGPEDASNKTVTWNSSNASVASVDQNGKVTAKQGGNATITAKAGDKTATCEVTVIAYVESVSLNKTTLTLAIGSSETLVATVKPDDATDKTITWTSSNTAVASVDQNGLVMALKGGNAVITARSGDKTATCSVTVTIPVESIILDKTSLSMIKGEEMALTATVYPANATDQTVVWRSSNTAVVTVYNGIVNAVGAGNTTVIATAGDKTATCSISVTVPVSGISLAPTSITLEQGETKQLTVSITPADATNKTVSWSSNDSSIASVSSNGVISALNEGDAIITARSADGGFEANCLVTVTVDPHPSVDLGLSVKWSKYNYGSTSETARGGYYMYGDPSGTGLPFEFNPPQVSSISGTQYDIVRKSWGGNWRIPTKAEVAELYNNCTWQSITLNGVSVYRVTGPNGNSIIMPRTGYGMPDDGPIGTETISDSNSVYTMTGNASLSGGVFVYVYVKNSSGSVSVPSYNAAFMKFPIRPVK